MPHLYLLVEWTKTNNHIPQYDIVSVIPEKYRDVNLKVGNIILMLKRREQTPRLCCVLRVSYVKQKLLELKSLLEDQTNGFRNYLLEYPHSESEQPNYATVRPETQSSSFNDLAIPINGADSAIRYIDHRYLDNDTSQIRRLASTPSQNVSSNRFHQPVCNVKPKKDKNTQTDSEITAGDQPNHLLHTEGKILLKQIYRNFIGIFGEVAGIRDIIANYPDLNQALGYDTDVEESVQNDATVVNDSSTFQDVVNSEVSSPGNITDATTTSQTVSDEQTEVADNSHAITTSTTATSTTPDNGKQEMVPIGSGYAWVPKRLLKEINWTSYTTATRQLLQAIFSRRVLATHSLTGKQSPAFTNKPAKKCLDPKLVEDIVLTVSSNCGVPKRLVRNCITIKCTDEAKLFRKRQLYREQQSNENEMQPVPSEETSSVSD